MKKLLIQLLILSNLGTSAFAAEFCTVKRDTAQDSVMGPMGDGSFKVVYYAHNTICTDDLMNFQTLEKTEEKSYLMALKTLSEKGFSFTLEKGVFFKH